MVISDPGKHLQMLELRSTQKEELTVWMSKTEPARRNWLCKGLSTEENLRLWATEKKKKNSLSGSQCAGGRVVGGWDLRHRDQIRKDPVNTVWEGEAWVFILFESQVRMADRTEKDFLFSGNMSTWQVHRELFICTEQRKVKKPVRKLFQ